MLPTALARFRRFHWASTHSWYRPRMLTDLQGLDRV
jgi:hypothetical protein